MNDPQLPTKPKPNYWKIFGVIVLIILVLGGAYYGLNYLTNNAYNKGLQDGALYVTSMISNTGQIPFLVNESGNMTLKYTNSSDIIQNYVNLLNKNGYRIVNS